MIDTHPRLFRLLCLLLMLAALCCAWLIPFPLRASGDVQLRASLTSPTRAVISWTQATRGCLYRETDFIGCYEAPGTYHITLGGSETDYTARPHVGDVIALETGGRVWRARVGWWVWLPVWRA